MASSLYTIKNVVNEESNSIYDLLKYFIYGIRIIPMYDSTHTYAVDDIVTKLNAGGEIEVFICTAQTSGEFDITNWEAADLLSIVQKLKENVAMVSPMQPTHRFNRIWYQALDQGREVFIPQPESDFDMSRLQILFNMDFPVVEEADDLTSNQENSLSIDPGDLLFDYEGDILEYDPNSMYNGGDYVTYDDNNGRLQVYQCNEPTTGLWDSTKWTLAQTSGDESFNNARTVIITDQDDVSIQDSEPNTGTVWIDTDLSDDNV